MLRFLTLLSFFVALTWAAKPMESHKNYNVILVHGAADMRSGLDCNNDLSIKEANDYEIKEGYLTLTGGYGERWGLSSDFPFLRKPRESSAEDMDIDNNGLQHWLVERVLLVVNFRLPVTS